MKTRQRALIVVGVAGLTLHAAVLLGFRGIAAGALLSNLIQFVLALAMIAACYDATSRSGEFGSRVWRFVIVSVSIYATGQAMVIWYENVRHASLMTFWLSSPLLFFWMLPLLLAVATDPLAPKARLSTYLALDASQLILLAITAYVAVFALPSQWASHGSEMELLKLKVRIGRDSFVLLALFLRYILSEFRLSRSLFRRLAAFMLVYSVADITYIYCEAFWGTRSGTLMDLLWSAPRLLLIVLAVTWSWPVEDEFAKAKTRRRAHYLHLAPVIVPIVILLLNDQLHHERPAFAYALEISSFLLAGVRLLLSQRDRDRMVAAISQANALFTSVIEGVDEAIYIRDLEGRYVLINSAGVRLLGLPPEQILGKTDREIMDPQVAAKVEASDRFVLQSRKSYSADEDFQSGGNIRRVLSTKSVHLSPEGHALGVLGVAIDVTERRKLEDQVQRAQRMESIGTFSGGLAHDFNNLLTVILGYADLLLSEKSDAKAAEPLREIHGAASRAAQLTRQLLAFSRRQVLQPRIIRLNDTITNLHKMLGRLIGEDIHIHLDLDPKLGAIEVDEAQIEQVIMNLAANSRDAMPRGGSFTIRTANLDFERDVEGIPLGSYVELKVEDTGEGIPPEVIPRIFDPFFTTKPLGKGTGLGLATAYGIVTQSGGYITLKSTPGVGTVFQIVFPRVFSPLSDVKGKTPMVRSNGEETILLVEDDRHVRELAQEALRKAGYKVLVAGDGDSAFKTLVNFQDPIHLLLTDLVMPGMNGEELARKIRLVRAGIRVIYMSGYAPDTVLRSASEAGGTFVGKPFTTALLLNAVRVALDAPNVPGA